MSGGHVGVGCTTKKKKRPAWAVQGWRGNYEKEYRMADNHDRYITALQDEHEMVGAFIRGTITEATLKLAHTSTQTARERMDNDLPPPCACGAPSTYSLNPGEIVTHSQAGCTVGPVIAAPAAPVKDWA